MTTTTCSVLLCVAIAITTVFAANFQCPPKDGQYQDSVQCDKYYECKEGVASTKLCPDGLVFDQHIRKINKCDQPFNIDCEDRIELQEPQSNNECPRKNGFFAHPDPAVCNIFFNCIDGHHTEIVCTAGLHFDEYQGVCVWPDAAGRQGCIDPEKKLKDGFVCPTNLEAKNGQTSAHPQFAHPEDCQKFYVCLSGINPRELGCPSGQAYNDRTHMCDSPENVPGCEDWYKDEEETAAAPAKPSKRN